MARWRDDPRAGTDNLYDETADEVSPPTNPVRAFAGFVALCLAITAVLLPLWFGVTVFSRATFNWMDGYGFTPVTHAQPIAPASFSPASVTLITLPGEVAQP